MRPRRWAQHRDNRSTARSSHAPVDRHDGAAGHLIVGRGEEQDRLRKKLKDDKDRLTPEEREAAEKQLKDLEKEEKEKKEEQDRLRKKLRDMGDKLNAVEKKKAEDELERLTAAGAAADAEAMEHAAIGAQRVDTGPLTVEEAAEAIAAQTGWPPSVD